MRKMKDSRIPWVGLIPEHWEMVRVKNIFNNHKNIVGEKESEFERLALTLNGVIKRDKNDSKGLQSENLSTYQILNEKELVFKMIDLANVNTSRVGYSPYTGIVSPVYIILNNDDYSKYGYYYFYSMWQREIFNNLGNDGVRSALNASDMMNLPFPNISVQEAKTIANFLDVKIKEIDIAVEKTKETIEDYKKLKQSMITESVLRGLKENKLVNKKINNTDVDIPVNWDIKKIKFCTKVRNEKYNIQYGNMNYFALENIISGTGLFVETENIYDLDGSIICERGDVVFGKLRPYLAKVYKSPIRQCCSSEFAVFYDFEGVNDYYKYLFLSHWFVNIVDSSTYGTKMPRANIDFINNIFIPLPPIKEQKEIVNYLDYKCSEIDNLIKSKEKIVEELENYKKSVIYEYVTGKKEVK